MEQIDDTESYKWRCGMVTKLWDKDEIKNNLKSKDIWVTKGVVAIYNLQTEDEKRIGGTRDHNGIGFNGADGEIMSSFANQIIRWNRKPNKYRSPLSYKQMILARKKILKYAGQLSRIANGEIYDT